MCHVYFIGILLAVRDEKSCGLFENRLLLILVYMALTHYEPTLSDLVHIDRHVRSYLYSIKHIFRLLRKDM